VAGPRGAGKSTLLRWINYELEPEWIGIYLSAPMVYNVTDFVRMIFGTTVREVIKKQSSVLHQGWLTSLIEPFRRPSTERRIAIISQKALASITGSSTNQRTRIAGISGKGIGLQLGRQAAWTEREPSHPELVEAYKEYLEQYRALGGCPIVVTIDELDKIAKIDDAIAVVNGLKDLFHIPNTHFVVSVAEDSLRRFAMRGIPFRDVFDSAFDTIVKVHAPSPDDAWKMLARRVGEVEAFPMPVALFCYAWSGGLPRDIIRAARTCVQITNNERKPVSVAELAQEIVKRDVANAVEDAITRNLTAKRVACIDELLALRHKIKDESALLQSTLSAWKFEETAMLPSGARDDTLTLQRLSAYVKIGSVVLESFSDEISILIAGDWDRILSVVEDLAKAKSALAMCPAEAEWFFACARTKLVAIRWAPIDDTNPVFSLGSEGRAVRLT
jgi:hypothetical protein